MVRTSGTRLHREHFALMQQRGLMAAEYDTPEEMVEAYLQADWLVRDRAYAPQMDTSDRERVRQYLLSVLREPARV
jgi:hypothetical protein